MRRCPATETERQSKRPAHTTSPLACARSTTAKRSASFVRVDHRLLALLENLLRAPRAARRRGRSRRRRRGRARRPCRATARSAASSCAHERRRSPSPPSSRSAAACAVSPASMMPAGSTGTCAPSGGGSKLVPGRRARRRGGRPPCSSAPRPRRRGVRPAEGRRRSPTRSHAHSARRRRRRAARLAALRRADIRIDDLTARRRVVALVRIGRELEDEWAARARCCAGICTCPGRGQQPAAARPTVSPGGWRTSVDDKHGNCEQRRAEVDACCWDKHRRRRPWPAAGAREKRRRAARDLKTREGCPSLRRAPVSRGASAQHCASATTSPNDAPSGQRTSSARDATMMINAAMLAE